MIYWLVTAKPPDRWAKGKTNFNVEKFFHIESSQMCISGFRVNRPFAVCPLGLCFGAICHSLGSICYFKTHLSAAPPHHLGPLTEFHRTPLIFFFFFSVTEPCLCLSVGPQRPTLLSGRISDHVGRRKQSLFNVNTLSRLWYDILLLVFLLKNTRYDTLDWTHQKQEKGFRLYSFGILCTLKAVK